VDWLEIRTALKAALLPPGLPLCVAAFGLLLSIRLPWTGRAIVGVGLVVAWLTSTWALAGAVFGALEAGQRPLDAATLQRAMQGPRPPRAVVVLSVGVRRDGQYEPRGERLTPKSMERAVAAARVARLAKLPIMVHGHRDVHMEMQSVERMRRVIEDELGATVRWVENSGGVGHAEIGRNIARALSADGIDSVIVSAPAHNMPRLAPALEAAGLKVLPAPHTFRADEHYGIERWLPNADAVEANGTAFYEWLGLLSYRLPGRALVPRDAHAPEPARTQ